VREFVGVKSYADLFYARSLKREALVFNKIAIPSLNLIEKLVASGEEFLADDTAIINEALWLRDNNIVFDPGKTPSDAERITDDRYKEYKQLSIKAWKSFVEYLEFDRQAGALDVLVQTAYQAHLRTRCIAIELREIYKLDAYPVYYFTSFQESPTSQSLKRDIIQFVLNSLPVPDDSTPWEQIIEYRSDTDSQSKFLALRHWMSEVARAELTPAEVEEKLEYLIDQYRQHMRLHRMKTNAGTLETIVTTSAEVLGDLASFKWGKAAEALFSLKKRQVALLEGELTAPGNEVAYIVKARETFS
jgi:hypothetical protein